MSIRTSWQKSLPERNGVKKRKFAGKLAVVITALVLAALVCCAPALADWKQEVCHYLRPERSAETEAGEEENGETETESGTAAAGSFWNIGDVVNREIDGEIYTFRCIDQNYADQDENHLQGALFLCDSVIPANYSSDYVLEEMADGSHDYVFAAGPIVNFGNIADYKYSRIRAWLQKSEDHFTDALTISTGIARAYTGSTEAGMFSAWRENSLTAAAIGMQQMTDRLFILSVDEAVQYREYLWRFGNTERENPQTQVDEFCTAYWLRSPMGTTQTADTGYMYTVDLVQGNICAKAIMPGLEGEIPEDDELAVTGTVGVRPVFVLPQA